jgi:hypothetical protein
MIYESSQRSKGPAVFRVGRCAPAVAGLFSNAVWALALMVCSQGAADAEGVTRQPGELIGAFAKRLLPHDDELATKAVEVDLGLAIIDGRAGSF